MSCPPGEITHVSDTALMVAACRALESEEPDAFVHDPFARRLAGERGIAMVRALLHPEVMRFGLAVRTRFIDDLLRDVLASGTISTVLSVGCGLDTRPWRLDLPPELRWIEADFADMLDYKDALMSGEPPRCRRERIPADVNDPAQRRRLYTTAGAAPALLITEGLLAYLPAGTVEALAAEAVRETGITDWIADIATTAFSQAIGMDRQSPVRHVQAPDALAGEQIVDCLRRHGWLTAARRSYISDIAFAMERIQRLWGDRSRAATPPPPDDPTGVHRFARP